MNEPPLLALSGIRKRFGGVVALDGVSFDLRAGEIHALAGENGAGKSTLIRILGGIQPPDAGQIHFAGKPEKIRNVADAERLGIRLIHQELALAPNLSVAENIFLGREPVRRGFLSRRSMIAQAEALRDRLGLPEIGDVRAPVSELNVARKQLVEIARALSSQVRALVLDEPTASLSFAETEALLTTLRRLRDQQVGLIYISHRLDEVRRLADRVTVLRDGKTVGTLAAGDWDTPTLIRWMVGRDVEEHAGRPRHQPGEAVLRVNHLTAPGVRDVSFELRAGEVLGLAGLVGAGRTEVARTLFGLNPIQSGSLELGGRPYHPRAPAEALRAGLVLVSEDRQRDGLVMTQTVAFNLTLPWVRDWIRGCVHDRARRAEIVDRALRDFAIRAANPELPVAALSGGNQQKVVVGRWMEHPPKVLILDEPTRGVDVGARAEMFRLVHQLVDQGLAVLLISSDLPEVMSLSHRLALYRDGRILRETAADQITAEEVMHELTRH